MNKLVGFAREHCNSKNIIWLIVFICTGAWPLLLRKEFDKAPWFMNLYLFFALGIFVLAVIAFMLISFDKSKLHRLYFVIGITLGVIYMVLIPLNTVPDENAHSWVAYHVSNKMMGIDDFSIGDEDYLRMRKEDDEYLVANHRYTITQYKAYLGSWNVGGDESIVKTEKTILKGHTVPYIVPGIALTVGRLMHVGTMKLFMMGRLANLFFFVCVLTLAIRLMPYCKEMLFAIATLPMTVQLSMSYSYDVMIISFTCLLAAMTLNMLDRGHVIKKWEYVLYAIVLLTLLGQKAHVYILFLVLPVLIFVKRKEISLRKFIPVFAVLVLLGIVAVIAALMVGRFAPDLIPVHTKILSWNGKEGYSVGLLLTDQELLRETIVNTVRNMFEYFHSTMLGNLLGWLDIPMNYLLVGAFDFVLVFSALKSKEDVAVEKSDALTYFGIALGTFFIINIAMLLAYSPISGKQVVGLQGRYFIPIIPFALLAFRRLDIEVSGKIKKYLPVIVLILQMFVIDNIMNMNLK